MSNVIATCFEKSHLRFTTKNEYSNGVFRPDSIFKYRSKENNSMYTFILTAGVPAGKMYHTNSILLKKPSYLYQMIASDLQNTILRTPLENENEYDQFFEDTSCENEENFTELTWSIEESEAIQFKGDEFLDSKLAYQSINTLLKYETEEIEFQSESPLKHWNHRKIYPNWQIETGYLLWPRCIESFCKNPITKNLLPMWLHANNSNSVTISNSRIGASVVEANLTFLAF